MTKKWVLSAWNGRPLEVSNEVCGWKQQSVCSLQFDVRMPSQSMSMSAFQTYALPALQIAIVDLSPAQPIYEIRFSHVNGLSRVDHGERARRRPARASGRIGPWRTTASWSAA